MISSRLFSVDFGSAIKIVSFSVKHKSHSFPPLDKGCALAFIDQVTFVSKPSFLHFVRYVDSEVELGWAKFSKFQSHSRLEI